MKVIGIDPGVEGAIAMVYDTKLPELWDLEVTSIGATKQISPQGLIDILVAWGDIDAIFMEDNRANGSNGALANFSMGLSMGVVTGVAAALARPFHRVKPKEWQAQFGLSNVRLVERKNAHRQRARELFPSMDTSLNLIKHHNRADALLIAEYGRRLIS